MANREGEFSLHFDAKSVTLLLSIHGRLSESLLLAAYAAVQRFAASRSSCRAITDFSGVDRVEISSDFVRRLASAPPAIPSGNLRVLVAPKAEMYGLSRMFQIMRDHMDGDLHVVRTLREAFQLLDLRSPSFLQVEPEAHGKRSHLPIVK